MTENIRNFCVISHVDHGKSTLADRFLELTGAMKKSEMQEQTLDQMDLERERGITIKMQPCFMEYELDGKKYELNLIDTPGHMDFSYEVERSLSAVEGAILLVDVVSGIQAQTLANLYLAKNQNLVIIPVINKIDMCPSDEQLENVKKEVSGLLEISEQEILLISAKTGKNVEKLLEAVIERVPSPKQEESQDFKSLVFDCFYDNFQGVVAFIRVFSGEISKNDQIFLLNQKQKAQAREIGIFRPKQTSLMKLEQGRIGYIATGIKQVENVRIGETITLAKTAETAKPLAGYQEPKSLVFANLFPSLEQNFEILKENLEKLRLNDTALTLASVNNMFLGRGFRVGFLGMLHLEITMERLKREYDTTAVITSPSVVFRVRIKNKDKFLEIHSANEMLKPEEIEYIEEPIVKLNIISPTKYISSIHQLVEQKRGEFVNSEALDKSLWIMKFRAPLSEIIEDFLDKLKSITQGFGSFSYEFDCYQKSDLVKLDFLVSRQVKPSLSKIVHRTKSQQFAREFLKRLKETLPSKNFMQALQAVIGGKIIARENVKAMRKDVTAPLYGGDVTRKRKLLERQKKGKKALEKTGTTSIPHEVYLKLIRK